MKDSQQTADDNGGTAMSQDPFLEREAGKRHAGGKLTANRSGAQRARAASLTAGQRL